MRKQYSINSRRIKSSVGTRLQVMILRRDGRGEIFHAPECAKCGLPILDFGMANVSKLERDSSALRPAGRFEDAEVFRTRGYSYALHKECDDSSGVPWAPAELVFRADQRHSWEKRGLL
jgi:hypothetical protein